MKKIKIAWKDIRDNDVNLSVPYNVAWAVARAVAKDQHETVRITGEYGTGTVNPDGTADIKWANGEENHYEANTIAAL